MKIKFCLLIENDPEDQEIFLQAVHTVASDAGCYAVSNGEEAIFTMTEEKFIPDLIFTDINMPKMDGLEFLKIIKSAPEFKSIPVIIYSGDYSEPNIQKAKSLGATAIYSKTRISVLIEILKRHFT